MKRKNEMHIMHLLMSIIIFTSLIITSANASGLWEESPQGCGCGCHHYCGAEIHNGAGTVNMNGGSISLEDYIKQVTDSILHI